jgi:HlyD family secretion protein
MPDDDKNTFIPAAIKTVFALLFIISVLLAYVMIAYMHSPSDNDLQQASPRISQNPQEAPSQATSNEREIAVAFLVSGRIAQMFFAEHDRVKQGDILAALDKAPFEEALTEASAQLRAATDAYTKPIHFPVDVFNAIEAARANVENAQYAYDAAHRELQKRRRLVIAGQTDNVYDDDVQNERDALLNLEKTRRELSEQENVALDNSDRDIYKTAMETAQSNVGIAETNLAATQLVAPADGIIIKRVGDIGDTVSADTMVYTLSSPAMAASEH